MAVILKVKAPAITVKITAMTDAPTITLIGGSGRSGTTLLRRLLGRHEAVCESPEWRVPVDPGGLVDFYTGEMGAWSPLLFDARLQALRRLLQAVSAKPGWLHWYRRALHASGLAKVRGRNLDVAYGQMVVTRFCPNFEELTQQLLTRLEAFRYHAVWAGSSFLDDDLLAFGGPFDESELRGLLGGFFRGVVSSATAHAGAQHYIEKNTWYPLVFDRFLELVPEARLVVIRRDPRDVVCSLMEQRWAPSELDAAAYYYNKLDQRWTYVRKQLTTDVYLEVEYEELVENPEIVLASIGEFASIPIAQGPYGLSTKSIGRWRNNLTPTQIERLGTLLAVDKE